jgi:elongation factor Ts
MVIDAKTVQTLREKTGAGLMACKGALTEAKGDLEAAIDILRTKGAATVIKKGDREAKEGVIAQAILPGAKLGVVVEINCETDFVAKNDQFRAFCDEVAKKLAADPSADVEAERTAAVQKLGENILVRRKERIEVKDNGLVAAYIHTGAKVGVLVEVGADKTETASNEDFKQLVRDITLQIAAANPICISRDEVPADLVARERAIYADQVPAGKPQPVIEKIIDGKMGKFYAGSCLLEQAFIKNPDQTVQQLIDEKSKTLGEKISIRRFVRYMVGEALSA